MRSSEELGFDGVTVTEHHAPLMVCPSPHLLLAAAVQTSRIRLGTAVTVLPLYSPLRVAEEAGLLDLLSGGRFELGLGRGVPREALFASGRDPSDDDLRRAWLEGLEVVHLALTTRDFTFDGEFFPVQRPIAVSGTPDEIIAALQQVMASTGARRLLVETFSRDEARLFAREVLPALRSSGG